MSDNILKIIPASPRFVPEEAIVNAAINLLEKSALDPEDISVNISDSPEFFDPGTNWDRVVCPDCKTVLDTSWWQNAMDEAYKTSFWDLSVKTPCCNTETSLNDLQYEWPAGFARISIELKNPVGDINDFFQAELEAVLNTPIRKIWVHY